MPELQTQSPQTSSEKRKIMSKRPAKHGTSDSMDKRCPVCKYEWHYCICEVDGHYPGGDPIMSKREREMLEFGGLLCQHVGEYTVSQYGDAPNDYIGTKSARDCEKQIEKYVRRFQSNLRDFDESQTDLLKIAHYCCLAYNKRLEEKANHKATLVE